MSERTKDIIGTFVLASLAFLWVFIHVWIGLDFAHATGVRRMQREAIDHGYAQHDPQTGEWMWREEGK